MSHVLYKTTDYTAEIFVTEDDDVTPVSLTGKTLTLVVKRYAGQAALVTLTSGSGIVHRAQSGAGEGRADATILTAASADLEAASNHIVYVLLDGQVVVPPRYLEIVGL
jgi:hypothetical protein